MDEPENRKKRYCLICHLFKPERCHHCSTCQRCVLGMDHHCPWLLNCIGYYNRKFFMLSLLWGSLGIINLLIMNIPMTYALIMRYIYDTENYFILNNVQNWEGIIVLVLIISLLVLFLLLLNFMFFHFKLIRDNNTTLDFLDSKRSESPITSEVRLKVRRRNKI